MLNCGHPMYIFWGARGACLYNDAYRKSIGPERHPCSLGRPALEVWSEIWDAIGPQIDQVMGGRGSTWHENQLIPITRNGKREDVYWTYSFSPIDDSTALHGVGGVLVVCTETTEKQQSLQRSIAERERFAVLASIVESSDDAIISKDLNGTILSWNGGAERLFGYTAGEVVGQPGTILIPSGFLDEEPVILGRILNGEHINHYETIRHHKDGTPIHVSLTVSPIRDSTGKIVGASKVGRDITHKKNAHERQSLLLREMSHRVKNVFAVASGVVGMSARAASTIGGLVAAVRSRLEALSRAQDLILSNHQNEIRTVRLLDLARTILSPFDMGHGHISVAGPPIECGSNAATSMALLLHEFATNSVKYGALMSAEGRIGVEFETGPRLGFSWTETGGPPIHSAVLTQGFGGVLVDATVASLGGTIERNWSATGLNIQLSIPLERIIA
jgi:PAS domain S-box-containing protein